MESVMSGFSYVIKRNGSKVPFTIDRITNAIYRAAVAIGERDKNVAKELALKAVTCLEATYPPDHNPHIEEIQDCVEETIIKQGLAELAKAYILYRSENKKRRDERARRFNYEDNIPWEKIWRTLRWAVNHDLHSIEALNARIAKGQFADIVQESEAFYHSQVSDAADMILDRSDSVRMVFVSGPSSSGKTTTTIKLEQKLNREGLRFVSLNVDNYFFDLSMHPRDEFGDYDFETPQALDLALINDHLRRLMAGEEILVPRYDFPTGTRFPDQTPLRMHPGDILLIDSLHGLNRDFSKDIDDRMKFRLYLEPLMQMQDRDGTFIRWTDIRMMRRMLRDEKFRAYNPEQTLLHWHYVRASEMRHIIPNNIIADMIINSAMPYELPIYQPQLVDHFAQWQRTYKDEPLREDAYNRAKRTYEVLKQISPVHSDAAVPTDSVIREFIGGSSLKYH